MFFLWYSISVIFLFCYNNTTYTNTFLVLVFIKYKNHRCSGDLKVSETLSRVWMFLWRTVSVKQQVCAKEGIQQLFRPARMMSRKEESVSSPLSLPWVWASWWGSRRDGELAGFESPSSSCRGQGQMWRCPWTRLVCEGESRKSTVVKDPPWTQSRARGNSGSSHWKISIH